LLGYQTACDLEVIQIIHNVDAQDNIAEISWNLQGNLKSEKSNS